MVWSWRRALRCALLGEGDSSQCLDSAHPRLRSLPGLTLQLWCLVPCNPLAAALTQEYPTCICVFSWELIRYNELNKVFINIKKKKNLERRVQSYIWTVRKVLKTFILFNQFIVLLWHFMCSDILTLIWWAPLVMVEIKHRLKGYGINKDGCPLIFLEINLSLSNI